MHGRAGGRLPKGTLGKPEFQATVAQILRLRAGLPALTSQVSGQP